jgi:pimeloyl-ACP methyl ester carboxylesterase
MRLFEKVLVVLTAFVLAPGNGCAEGAGRTVTVWSQWESRQVERLGPESATGALFYFHGYDARSDTTDLEIPEIFIAMAKAAKWDVLRVNRRRESDLEADDARILEHVAARIAEARQEGYRLVIVAGASRGGWLALVAATLDGVDAVIGMAPGVLGFSTEGLERSRDLLAERLQNAKARRIAAFFFDGDWLEDVPERRAVVVRRALQRTQSAFMVVDRPFDYYGHWGMARSGFVGRYRDCLVRFVQAREETGEIRCPFGEHSAMRKLPVNSNPMLAAYWGDWEGIDQSNAWLTLRSTELSSRRIHYELVHSHRPGTGFEALTGEQVFELDPSDGQIYCALPYDVLAARLKSPDQLELRRLQRGPTAPGMILRKRLEEVDAGTGQP